jgi:hypothetical protein
MFGPQIVRIKIEAVSLDSTIVKVHPDGTGALSIQSLGRLGMAARRGSDHKTLAARFQVKEKEYRRFMDFLRRNECLLDFRPYRKLTP